MKAVTYEVRIDQKIGFACLVLAEVSIAMVPKN